MTKLRRLAVAVALVAVAVAPVAARGAKSAKVPKDWRNIEFPALPEFEIPKPQVYTLDNGLQVFLIEDHELPLINASILMRMGSNHEPADKVGLGSIYAQVLREGGTTKRGPDEIDEWLAARAATIESSMGGEVGRMSLSSLAEDFPDVLGLAGELLASPAFPEDKIDLAKTQERTAIARRNDDIGGIIGREFAKLVRGQDSPLARTPEYATLAAIGRDDLVAWHRRYVHPNNLMLGVVGDFDTSEMKDRIAAVFGAWDRGPDADLAPVAYREQPLPGRFFIEKTDVTQANIRMGHTGIRQDNPDFFAVQILNEVLGGGFTSRLFSTIRTDMGLAYNVFGSVGSSFRYPGLFQAGTQTKSENVSTALDALRGVLVDVIENPPTDEEIERAKDSILESFVFNYTSRAGILNQQMNYAYNGLPSDYLERYRTNIEAVTREQVAKAAKSYIRPDALTVLVVGNSDEFDKPLDEIGEFERVDISIPPPPDTAKAVVRSPETLERGAAVFDRTVALLGGGDPKSITGYRTSVAATISMQGQAVPVKQTTLIVFPDRSRTDLSIMGQAQTVVLDGDSGFMAAMGQSRDLPGDALERQRASIDRDVWYLVANHDAPAFDAIYVEPSEVDGTACDVIEVSMSDTKSRMCVASDGRVLRSSHQGINPLTRAPGRIETTFADFREIDGVPVAHRATTTFEGEQFLSGTVEEFELNPAPPEDAFARPGS